MIMALVKGIAHTAFNVKDMEKSVKFYEDVFGFTKAFEMINPEDNSPWIVYMHAGRDQFLELFYGGVNKVEHHEGDIGFSHICLEVEDIHAAAKAVTDHGAPLDVPVQFGLDNNWQCWTHDPDGNRIELMQMGEDSLQNNFIKSLK